MSRRFRHAALVGKYHAQGIRDVLDEIARFLIRQGLEVSLERETALNTGLADYGAMSPAELGQHCDIAIVVGGDGTMLGIARQLSRFGIPLVGINQGRLGFITDIGLGDFRTALAGRRGWTVMPVLAAVSSSSVTARPWPIRKAATDSSSSRMPSALNLPTSAACRKRVAIHGITPQRPLRTQAESARHRARNRCLTSVPRPS